MAGIMNAVICATLSIKEPYNESNSQPSLFFYECIRVIVYEFKEHFQVYMCRVGVVQATMATIDNATNSIFTFDTYACYSSTPHIETSAKSNE